MKPNRTVVVELPLKGWLPIDGLPFPCKLQFIYTSISEITGVVAVTGRLKVMDGLLELVVVKNFTQTDTIPFILFHLPDWNVSVLNPVVVFTGVLVYLPLLIFAPVEPCKPVAPFAPVAPVCPVYPKLSIKLL